MSAIEKLDSLFSSDSGEGNSFFAAIKNFFKGIGSFFSGNKNSSETATDRLRRLRNVDPETRRLLRALERNTEKIKLRNLAENCLMYLDGVDERNLRIKDLTAKVHSFKIDGGIVTLIMSVLDSLA